MTIDNLKSVLVTYPEGEEIVSLLTSRDINNWMITDGGKLKNIYCDHECAINLKAIRLFLESKKLKKSLFRKACPIPSELSQYLVVNPRRATQLFCLLTRIYLNNMEHDVHRHLQGSKFRVKYQYFTTHPEIQSDYLIASHYLLDNKRKSGKTPEKDNTKGAMEENSDPIEMFQDIIDPTLSDSTEELGSSELDSNSDEHCDDNCNDNEEEMGQDLNLALTIHSSSSDDDMKESRSKRAKTD